MVTSELVRVERQRDRARGLAAALDAENERLAAALRAAFDACTGDEPVARILRDALVAEGLLADDGGV